MCGIAGRVDFHAASEADTRRVRAMIAPLEHRGPDAQGVARLGAATLGHTRLSIIDLEGGIQPMFSSDGRCLLTFNGEIYNHVELRDELERQGHVFRTRSDTEVILQAWAAWGPACVDHFNGQWAFGLYDDTAGELFLSRDPMGVRPLFWTRAGNAFLFASEVKALFADPDAPRALNLRAVADGLTLWSPLSPATVFDGVEELPPGHSMTVSAFGQKTTSYSVLDYRTDPALEDEEAARAELFDLLIDATRLRLRADVPVGAYLSGGLDSTVTTALVRYFSDAPLKTYSVAFEHAEYDESAFQQAAARHLGTTHREVRISEQDIADVFPEVVAHAERPLFRTAPAPLFLLSKLVRDDGYKVVLTGEGADEVFGGYDLFKEAKIRRFWARQPESRFRPLLLKRLYPWMTELQRQPIAYLQRFFLARPEDLDSPLFSHLPRWELGRRLELFLSDEARAGERDPYADVVAQLPSAFSSWEPFHQAQYLESRMLLPGYILSAQGDRMAMSHSVEGRFPFLDPRVVAFGARLPPRLKMKGLDEKYLLKRAFGHLLPPEVTARKKQPYRAPDSSCFVPPEGSGRQEPDYVARLFDPERVRAYGVFHPGRVAALLKKARTQGLRAVKDNMAFVTVLSTQLLVERFLDRPERSPLPLSPTSKEQPHV